MRVLGVIDLMGGRAVHASGGDRRRYGPVQESGGERIDGDPIALARVYRDRFGIHELYVADLDAITGGRQPAETIREMASLGMPIWADAGVSGVDAARVALADGASRVIVGLETLTSFDALADICAVLGSDRVAFSLDLRDGVPMRSPGLPDGEPEDLASCAAAAGVGAIVAIDLRRVGSAAGLDMPLLARLRRAVAGVTLLAGGGVRTADDVARLAEAGCDGVLLATALHTGTIGPDDLAPFVARDSVSP